MQYYGANLKGAWTQNYTDIFTAMAAAAADFQAVVTEGQQVERELWTATSAMSGEKYNTRDGRFRRIADASRGL